MNGSFFASPRQAVWTAPHPQHTLQALFTPPSSLRCSVGPIFTWEKMSGGKRDQQWKMSAPYPHPQDDLWVSRQVELTLWCGACWPRSPSWWIRIKWWRGSCATSFSSPRTRSTALTWLPSTYSVAETTGCLVSGPGPGPAWEPFSYFLKFQRALSYNPEDLVNSKTEDRDVSF